MTIISLLVILILIGLLLYLANTFIPMDPKIKSILNITVVIIVILWLVGVFGLLGPLNRPIPQVR